MSLSANIDKLKCNTPIKSWRPEKKFVVKACNNGESKIIHYGATGYSDYTMHHDEKRRANFRARHKCDSNPPDKLSARYWACEKLW